MSKSTQNDIKGTSSECSPARSNDGITCFKFVELESFILGWNAEFKNDPIVIDEELISSWNGLQEEILRYNKRCDKNLLIDDDILKTYLWNNLNKKMEKYCGPDNEVCWTDFKSVTDKIKKINPDAYNDIMNFALKPKAPQGNFHTSWLSTTEIDNVLHQQEQINKDFKYISCVPSDHYELHPNEYKEIFNAISNYRYSAVVFNTDVTANSGEHWLTVLFENSGGKVTIEYFDSVGDTPLDNIYKFMKKIQKKFNAIVKISTYPHQLGNSQCGIYSINYIKQRINGKKFEDFSCDKVENRNKGSRSTCKRVDRIPDKKMEELRDEIFRKNTPEFTK
jgi:hypothetical protein